MCGMGQGGWIAQPWNFSVFFSKKPKDALALPRRTPGALNSSLLPIKHINKAQSYEMSASVPLAKKRGGHQVKAQTGLWAQELGKLATMEAGQGLGLVFSPTWLAGKVCWATGWASGATCGPSQFDNTHAHPCSQCLEGGPGWNWGPGMPDQPSSWGPAVHAEICNFAPQSPAICQAGSGAHLSSACMVGWGAQKAWTLALSGG